MFKGILDEIKKIEETQSISVPIDADENGYLDKECPAEECMFQFKVLEEDWANIFRDEEVFCPKCGHTAPSDSWWTTEQV